MDEKFQAIFEGKELPEDGGIPLIYVPREEQPSGTESVSGAETESATPAEGDSVSAEARGDSEEVSAGDSKPEEAPSESAPEAESEDESVDRLWECFGEINSANEETSAKLSAVMAQLDAMNRELSRLAAYDKAVDTLKMSLAANQNSEKNLYKEVEEYKKGTYFTNIKPFLMFLVDMLCELKKSRAQYIEDKEEFIAENNENSYNEIVGLLEFFIGSFENQMRIQGVEIISFEADSDYIAGQQRISKTVKTDDPEKNGKIASVLSDCYMYGNTVLRAAKVTAYKLG